MNFLCHVEQVSLFFIKNWCIVCSDLPWDLVRPNLRRRKFPSSFPLVWDSWLLHHFDGLLGGLIVIRTSTCRALLLKFTRSLSKAHVDAISIKTLHPVSSSFVIMYYFRKNQEHFNSWICIAFVSRCGHYQTRQQWKCQNFVLTYEKAGHLPWNVIHVEWGF